MMIRKVLRVVVIVLAAIAGSRCAGGGSTGTDSGGLRSVEFVGQLQSVQGKSLAGVEVIVEQTGARGVTDENGSFDLATEAAERMLTLAFVGGGLDGTVEIDSIPEGDSLVELTILADERANQLQVASLMISPRATESSSSSSAASGGGGSSSAHGQPSPEPSLFRGHLRRPGSGAPVPGALVRVIEIVAADITDSSGRFDMEGRSRGGDLTVEVTVGRSKGSIILRNVPKRSVVITLELVWAGATGTHPLPGSKPGEPQLLLDSVSYSNR